MIKGIKNIIFDVGGVLVDLDMDRCIESFKNIGFEGAEGLVSCYHPTAIFGALERGEVTREQFCDEIRSMAGGATFTDDEICDAYCTLLLGIPIKKLQLLGRLRREGYKLYALSNISAVMFPRILEFFTKDGQSAEYYFDDMFLSFEMGVMKPDVKIYEMILESTGAEPCETLFIDDAEKNVVAAREFGMMVYLASARESLDHLFE